MVEIIAEFFQIIGVEAVPPTNVAELIPYLLTVFIGVFLVSGVFSVLGKLCGIILDFSRWR